MCPVGRTCPIKAPWLPKGGCKRVVAKRVVAKGWLPKGGCKRVVAKGWLQKGGCKRVHLLIDSLENTDRTDPTRCRTTPTRTGQDQHGPELLQHGPDLPTRNTRIPNTHADQQHAARANTARARTARSMSDIYIYIYICEQDINWMGPSPGGKKRQNVI